MLTRREWEKGEVSEKQNKPSAVDYSNFTAFLASTPLLVQCKLRRGNVKIVI
jgi:hypothetical protein